MTSNELKKYILEMAGYLAPGEELTKEAADQNIRQTVAHVISARDASPILVATIALELARLLDCAGIPS